MDSDIQTDQPQSIHFSSKFQDWETTDEFFARLHREFQFTIDLAALAENAKLSNFLSPAENSLAQKWSGTGYLNPPYKNLKRWIEKAAQTALDGDATIIALIPARVDTLVWHQTISKYAHEVRFLKGRLKFIGPDKNAPLQSSPFPSALVVFRPGDNGGGPKISFVSV